jgi:putative drug exporter of the RND superfamily
VVDQASGNSDISDRLAAALIMIAVFSGFIFSNSVFIVALLMPALMHLLGRAAWWIPKWLDRIIPNLDIEGAALEREHHAV